MVNAQKSGRPQRKYSLGFFIYFFVQSATITICTLKQKNMAEKTLYYVQIATEAKVEQYIKRKKPKTVPIRAENIVDFFNKSSDEDVKEIIFDYTYVNCIYERGQSFDHIQKASLRGVNIKIVPPQGPQQEMQKKYKEKIEGLIPNIEEKIFD